MCSGCRPPASSTTTPSGVGVDVTLRLVTEEETGADHCQHDNPTIGQEIMLDWLVDRFGIDQRTLRNAQPL
jgi:hypothetical protein